MMKRKTMHSERGTASWNNEKSTASRTSGREAGNPCLSPRTTNHATAWVTPIIAAKTGSARLSSHDRRFVFIVLLPTCVVKTRETHDTDDRPHPPNVPGLTARAERVERSEIRVCCKPLLGGARHTAPTYEPARAQSFVLFASLSRVELGHDLEVHLNFYAVRARVGPGTHSRCRVREERV